MLEKIIHFIKYNNATIIILAVILILGGGALAAGPEAIGQQQTSVQGVDNTALLAADLDAFNMDFKIENIEQDETYYYATYSFLDLALANNVWQYQLSQRTQKISKKIKTDLGEYLAKFLAKHYEARLRELKQEKTLAQAQGEQKRVEVVVYSGLIGRALDLAAKVFPGYEPVVKRELPAPAFAEASAGRPDFSTPLVKGQADLSAGASAQADNLTKLYNDYVAAHPEVFNPSTGEAGLPAEQSGPPLAADTASSSPDSAGSPQADSSGEAAGAEASSTPIDLPAGESVSSPTPPAIPEPTSVDIIDLPAPSGSGEASLPAAPAPETTPEPAPAP